MPPRLPPNARQLLKKIRSRKARIVVIGLGYVGLPLAAAYAQKGFPVVGVDVDRERTQKIREGKSYVEDVPSRMLASLVRQGRLEVTDRYEALPPADAIFICVPTPLNRVKDPDLSYVLKATEAVRENLRVGQLVILESTTYPGTTEELILPPLQESGLRVGRDFFLCFSPERIDPGNKKFPFLKIPKVVGGVTPHCTRLGTELYRRILPQVKAVSSARTAEMAKLLENTFRIVNIGLANELAQVAHTLGVDIWEAIEAASTKPFGFMPFYPGPGIGGHCIGIDPVYLSWKARLHGVEIGFIELARRVNARMPRFVVEQALYLLNARLRKAARGSRILVLGISYKPDVGDIRESPALEILELLKELGARVNYHDPLVPELNNERLRLRSLPLTPQALKPQDLVIITTAHSKVNYRQLAKHARLIFDTRNVPSLASPSSNVVRL